MSEKYLGENSTPILINQIKDNCTQKRTTLPIASVDELGNTYQYTGTTSGSLVHGYFYECVSDEQDPTIYSWQNVNVQPTAGTPTAATTTFDNTTSELQATNVQGAIDEVDGRVDTAESDINSIEEKIPSTASDTNLLVDHDSLGTAAFKDSTDRVSPNNTALVESQSVYSAINTALSSIYTPRGDITCAELTSDLLIAANVGNIYETSDSGTTSALFLQGAGVSIPTGSNVGIINAGQGRILFNLMANAFDLTDYQKKDLTQAVEGQTTVEGALGALSTNKQDSLTFDNAPTENSNNPVKSSGIYSANQNIYEVMGQMGSKNLITYPHSGKTETKAGITFTENADGSVTVNGTATEIVRHLISSQQFEVGKKYILSGCPSGGSHSLNGTYTLYTQTVQNYDDGEGVEFTWDASITGITIAVFAGITVDNLTFKPMLRLASDTDSTYQPYAKTNQQLTAETQASTNQTNDIVNVYGAKNLIPYPYYRPSGYTTNGLTVTYDADGILTVNKVAGEAISFFSFANTKDYFLIPNTAYTLSMELENAVNTSVYIKFSNDSFDIAAIRNKATGKYETTFTTPSTFNGNLQLALYYGAIVVETNAKVKVMLRLASIQDDTYVPYAPTNKELMSCKLNGYVGAKNLLAYPYKHTTKSENGVTFTDNGDGTITVNTPTSASAETTFYLSQSIQSILDTGMYILSGCPSGGNRTSGYFMEFAELATSSSDWKMFGTDTGEGAIAHIDSTRYVIHAYIRIRSGATVSNLTFKPMIRRVEDTDPTWQPYAKTNRELTENVNELLAVNIVSTPSDLTPYLRSIKEGLTIQYFNISKSGNVVSISATVTNSTENDIAANEPLFYCNEMPRITSLYSVVQFINSNNFTRINLRDSGRVDLRNTFPSGESFSFSFTYISKELYS